MKYSANFLRDFNWYLKVRHTFTFDGQLLREIIFNRSGVDGRKAFHLFDSTGKLAATKHPNILRALLRTKASVNLHVKMYSEDRASHLLTLFEFKAMCLSWSAPEWFFIAVEKAKHRIIEADDSWPDWFKYESKKAIQSLQYA